MAHGQEASLVGARIAACVEQQRRAGSRSEAGLGGRPRTERDAGLGVGVDKPHHAAHGREFVHGIGRHRRVIVWGLGVIEDRRAGGQQASKEAQSQADRQAPEAE